MRVVMTFVAVVLFGSAPFAGSFAQRGLAAPRVTVERLEPLPMSAGQQRFRVSLLIDNQNTDPLRFRSIEFKLRLADQGILDGAIGPMTIEALDRRALQLELGSEIVSSLSRLMAFVEQPANTLPYEIHGVVTLDRRLRRLPFDERGQVPLVLTSER